MPIIIYFAENKRIWAENSLFASLQCNSEQLQVHRGIIIILLSLSPRYHNSESCPISVPPVLVHSGHQNAPFSKKKVVFSCWTRTDYHYRYHNHNHIIYNEYHHNHIIYNQYHQYYISSFPREGVPAGHGLRRSSCPFQSSLCLRQTEPVRFETIFSVFH